MDLQSEALALGLNLATPKPTLGSPPPQLAALMLG